MKKIDLRAMFQLFRNVMKQNWNKLWKRWKYQAPFLVFQNTETVDYIGKLLNVSVVSKHFETILKQALEKVKIPEPIFGLLKHWNNGLYREIIEMDWNMKKLGKSESFSVSKHFKTKLKQALEKVKIPGSIFGVSKHWNNGLYREIIETDWNMKKIDLSPNVPVVSKRFKQDWNMLWKRWKYQAPFLVFRNTETIYYIGILLKRTETWRKLT